MTGDRKATAKSKLAVIVGRPPELNDIIVESRTHFEKTEHKQKNKL